MKTRGQTLVLFALCLTVMLGISALAVDYANWLLIDRRMQNVSDHASLAGASVFRETIGGTSCREDPSFGNCQVAARVQAWTSLNQELVLGLSTPQIGTLALRDSPATGDTADVGGGPTPVTFSRHIWVSVPPPWNTGGHNEYAKVGGRLAGQQGVVFVRVDQPTRAFFAGIFGIQPGDRTGWATAGVLPNDFALEIFCRDGTNPNGSGSACVSKGIGIEGQGGITLIRGDIGSNQSLQVTAQTGQGVVLRDGNMFLANVSDTCGSSTWNCPPATVGGISDGSGNAKNAFYIPPQPYMQFASPLDPTSATGDTTVSNATCTGADASHLCVPFKGDSNHDWWCDNNDLNNLCGVPTVSTSVDGRRQVQCDARVGGTPSPHLVASSDGAGANGFSGSPPISGGADRYPRIDDDATIPDPDTTSPPAATPSDYIYTGNLGVSGGGATQAGTFNLRPPYGIPRTGSTTVRYTAFKTNGSAIDDSGNPVTLQVSLLQNGATIAVDPTTRPLTGTPTRYEFTVTSGVITNYTALSLKFTFTSSGVNDNSLKRGGGIAWAEAETPTLDPALPPMIPPGYYHSIKIPLSGSTDSCAIMDPTAVYSGLLDYQMPGIYRFGVGNDATINVGPNSFLIGDGVTLVFDPAFPDPTGGRGIVVGANGALVLNTSIRNVSTACESAPDTADYNASYPNLSALPYSSLCAGWSVHVKDSAVLKPGLSPWLSTDGTSSTRGYCDPTYTTAGIAPNQCVPRSAAGFAPVAEYRGVTFFFRTNNWPPSNIRDRFQLSGTTGSEPGVAFRGLMYAPWDDVKLTGGNGFNTIGQIFAWTAKFAGQSTIFLDYPYARCESDDTCQPFLLEPTLNQ
jgi:putative Flp pilus-assembly TadE/G-like protein